MDIGERNGLADMTSGGDLRRKTGFDAFTRLSAGICLLAGLLLHWSVLPHGVPSGAGRPAQSGLAAAGSTAHPAIPARDVARQPGFDARSFGGRTDAPAVADGPQPLAPVADATRHTSVLASSSSSLPVAARRLRSPLRVFDARGPPAAA